MYTNTVADKETEMTSTVSKMIAYENALAWYRKDFEKIETFMKNDAQTKTYVTLIHMIFKASSKNNTSGSIENKEAWNNVIDAITENTCKKMLVVIERLIFLEAILKENKTIFVDFKDRYKPVYALIEEVVEKMLLDLLVADHKE
jgi:hypothetical protein